MEDVRKSTTEKNQRLNSHFFPVRFLEGCTYLCYGCEGDRVRKIHIETEFRKKEELIAKQTGDMFYCPECGLHSRDYNQVIKEVAILG